MSRGICLVGKKVFEGFLDRCFAGMQRFGLSLLSQVAGYIIFGNHRGRCSLLLWISELHLAWCTAVVFLYGMKSLCGVLLVVIYLGCVGWYVFCFAGFSYWKSGIRCGQVSGQVIKLLGIIGDVGIFWCTRSSEVQTDWFFKLGWTDFSFLVVALVLQLCCV